MFDWCACNCTYLDDPWYTALLNLVMADVCDTGSYHQPASSAGTFFRALNISSLKRLTNISQRIQVYKQFEHVLPRESW